MCPIAAVKLDSATTRRLDRIGDEFMADVFRYESERRENLPALFELGAVLTRLGLYEEGLGVDRRLVRMQPTQPVLRYNLACSLALLGRLDESIAELSTAIDLGYDDVEHMVKDKDLKSLHGDSRFEQLAGRLRAFGPR